MHSWCLDGRTELDRRAQPGGVRRPAAERLVFVPNTTAGVAIALGSVAIAAGDELLTTDHAYRACRNQLERLAAARGATITTVTVPLPFDAGALVDAVTRAITPRTRLALFDHITSASALRLPIEALVAAARDRGCGGRRRRARPGPDRARRRGDRRDLVRRQLPQVAVRAQGCGFLAVSADADARRSSPPTARAPTTARQPAARRARLERHLRSVAQFAVSAAIEAVAGEVGGWPAVYRRNHDLVLEMARRLSDALGARARRCSAPRSARYHGDPLPIQLPAGLTPEAIQLQCCAMAGRSGSTISASAGQRARPGAAAVGPPVQHRRPGGPARRPAARARRGDPRVVDIPARYPRYRPWRSSDWHHQTQIEIHGSHGSSGDHHDTRAAGPEPPRREASAGVGDLDGQRRTRRGAAWAHGDPWPHSRVIEAQ